MPFIRVTTDPSANTASSPRTWARVVPCCGTRAPPAFVAVAGHDVLRDEGIAYARALEAAGVPVTLREYADMTHGFLRWGGVVDRTRELIAELGEYARISLRGASD